MRPQYVYLAGPIMGCTKGEANDWRRYVDQKLQPHGITGVSPLRCEPDVNGVYAVTHAEDPKFGTARAIAGKNWHDTSSCDVVLAYLPTPPSGKWPSLGTVAEIAWARALAKTVILVTDDPVMKEHPVLGYCANWILDDLDQAVDVLVGVLGGYTGGKNI